VIVIVAIAVSSFPAGELELSALNSLIGPVSLPNNSVIGSNFPRYWYISQSANFLDATG
jgi:hypothetical protein